MIKNKGNNDAGIFFAAGCGRCKLFDTPQCKVHNWKEELALIRTLVLECELTEELKWGVPTYTFKNKNIAILGALKNCVVLGFFKGALLKDEYQLLVKPGDNSQIVRQFRFTNLKEITKVKTFLKAYVKEAIELEKSGAKVELKKNPEALPEELINKLEELPALKKAFYALTPGRQRGYILHFSQAKQSATRLTRIEKCVPKIMAGKGMME